MLVDGTCEGKQASTKQTQKGEWQVGKVSKTWKYLKSKNGDLDGLEQL